jgi:glycosyltransferase involved in cell wall biosynthesis
LSSASLSLILPVFNSERTVIDQVHRLLEILPDLTTDFEIMIVDDGSTDNTCELADELSNEYPQVKVIRHGERRGLDGIVETSLSRTHSKVVMLATPGEFIPAAELRKLWEKTQLPQIPTPRPYSKSLLGKLSQWGTTLLKEQTGSDSVRLLYRDGNNTTARREQRPPTSFLAHLQDLARGE